MNELKLKKNFIFFKSKYEKKKIIPSANKGNLKKKIDLKIFLFSEFINEQKKMKKQNKIDKTKKDSLYK